MFRNQIIEPIGLIIAVATFLFSMILFYSDNQVFLGSLWAALMAAGLAWGTYLVLRITWLAIKKNN